MEGLLAVIKLESNLLLAKHRRVLPVIFRHARRILAVLCAALSVWSVEAAESPTETPAKVEISGFGFLGNRELVHLLRNFQPDGKIPTVIDRTFVEDAALVLLARAHDDGFLSATLDGEFTMTNGSRQNLSWTNAMDALLPREFAARKANFDLKSGVRFYYESIQFTGITAFTEREAASYFVSGDVLLKLRANRVFSRSALSSSLTALREAYARAGYESAIINTNRVTRNASTGEVSVEVGVKEGLPTIVRSVNVRVDGDDETPEAERTLKPDEPYSRLWQQGLAQKLQAKQQAKGFPDATVEFTMRQRETNAASIQLDLSASVIKGPFVRVGNVIEEGKFRTRPWIVKRRIKIKEGEPLNVIEAEKSRQRLARLGAFDSVRLRYAPVDENTRDVIYEIEYGKPLSLSVLAGVGTYELLRGGLELENRDLFGLAHNLRLRGVQSFKSTSGDLLYTVPEAFGKNITLFMQGSGLRREEVTFTREEYGGSVGMQRRLATIKTDFTLRYDYEFLEAVNLDDPGTDIVGDTDAQSAAFVIELVRDRRDNPLLPRRGSRLFSVIEIASAGLGGNVNYQRLMLGAAYHLDLNGGRLVHLGIIQGMSFTFGGDDNELPFNKRFFPGGENSQRGYKEGEASPLDDDKQQVGAETYTQVNLEFEQLVTKTWSVVVFSDTVGYAEHRADYPWDKVLYSVGGGLRWRSAIGPVRLEYGYNLNPRPRDPVGTLNFSIGVPF